MGRQSFLCLATFYFKQGKPHAENKIRMDTVARYRRILVMLSYDRYLLTVIHVSVLRHAPKGSCLQETACK